jgi:hypothetical protein
MYGRSEMGGGANSETCLRWVRMGTIFVSNGKCFTYREVLFAGGSSSGDLKQTRLTWPASVAFPADHVPNSSREGCLLSCTDLRGSVVVATSSQVSCELADEVMILNLNDGVYYGLDAVGTRIWELLQEQRPVTEMRDTLLAEFEVTEERCERDLLRLLNELIEARLVEVVPTSR